MFNTAVEATQDVTSQVQLRKLKHASLAAKPATPPNIPNRFRVYGWRWHHLGIVRDLSRLQTQIENKRRLLCPVQSSPQARSTRLQLVDSLHYILHDNWNLLNYVESTIFLPWLARQERDVRTSRKRLSIIQNERHRLLKDSQHLSSVVTAWVDVESSQCEQGLHRIMHLLSRLNRNAHALFEASESVVIPRVRFLFSEKEQLRLNRRILNAISPVQARISLVIFRDAVDQQHPVVANRQDKEDFEHSVPAPIRTLGVPYWRRKFVDRKMRFLTQPLE